MHAAGTGWGRIALEVGTSKSNVGRIVTGARWKHLHPVQRPDLYESDENPEATVERPAEPALVVAADDPLAGTMQRIYIALSEAA